jgi:nitroimidazol reductase NimA-like FMN-containing flavoprotein (pyridoxamine 5'-phosphate oxidase superfamily)
MSTQTVARGQATENTADSFGVTPVNKVKRVHERGRYDRKTVYEILDAALVCHIAYVIDGRPYCTPTSFWREGDHLYWHGSSASRMIRTQGHGVPVCLTVTHLDALVMARSGFHHSVNYRAVMAFGTAHIIDDVEKKLRLMDRFIDRIYPERSTLIRQPNKQEFKATTMMGMEIEHASGKIRDKHVADEEEALPGDAGHRRAVGMRAPAAGPRAARGHGRLRARHPPRRADDEELPPHVRLTTEVPGQLLSPAERQTGSRSRRLCGNPRKPLMPLLLRAVAAAGRCRVNSDSNDNARSSPRRVGLRHSRYFRHRP